MKQDFRKEGDNLIITLTVPMEAQRSNPYDEDYHSVMDNIIGCISGMELTFNYLIDREYKGKDDDISIPFFIYNGEEGDFINLCETLGIGIYKYPVCVKCSKVIYGSHTWDNGEICFECENKK